MDVKDIRKKPGMSNAYTRDPNLVYAGPHDTYPLGDKPRQISMKKVAIAKALAHHAGKLAPEIQANIKSIVGKYNPQSLANVIIKGKRK